MNLVKIKAEYISATGEGGQIREGVSFEPDLEKFRHKSRHFSKMTNPQQG